MSSIPNKKIKHAHVAHDEGSHETAPKPAKAKAPKHESLAERAKDLAEEAVDVVKERPKTVAAIGAAVLAGAAALVGGPAIAKAVRGEDKKPTKKTPAKKKTKA